MTKPVKRSSAQEVLAEYLQDEKFRVEWERTALARAVRWLWWAIAQSAD